jgi:hypothetical protein
MRDEMFADPWLDGRPQPGDTERELGLRGAPRPPDSLPGTKNPGLGGASSAPDPVPSRAHATPSALPVGGLLYLVLVGLVAVTTTGVFFGAGFLLLVHSGKETVVDASTRDFAPPPPDRKAARVDLKGSAPRESTAPEAATAAAPSGASLTQPAAVAEASPPGQSEPPENPPVGASASHPHTRTAVEPEPTSGSRDSSTSATPLPRLAPFPVAETSAPVAAKNRSSREGRSHHSQTAARHLHPRSAYSAPTLTPPREPQTGPFDRLLTVLTGRSGSLTPPRAQ